MEFWSKIKNASFYKRSLKYGDKNAMTLIQEESGFLGFAGDKLYNIQWSTKSFHYECFVHQEVGAILINTENRFYFKISSNVAKILVDLKNFLEFYTSSSCKMALKNYPTVYKFVQNKIFDDYDWHIEDSTLRKCINCNRSSFDQGRGIEIAKDFAADVDKLFAELKGFKLDTSKLKKIKPIVNLGGLPKWAKVGATIGGVILIKLAIRSIGQDIDIDISNSDGDYDCNDPIDCSFDSSNSYDGYNVTFGASENSDGYISQGNISLERTVSGTSDSFDHYTKNGHEYVKVGNNYIRIDKGNTVTIKGIKYDCI